MADYCTVADVKALAGMAETTDDTLLGTLITRASALIDRYTGTTFAERTETRYYTPSVHNDGNLLLLDDDLLSVTTLTNGDGEVIPSSGYVLYPLNKSPKYGIKLKSDYSWTYTDDPEGAISVAGTWGYCTEADRPADITQACARLALWLYRQKDAPFGKMGNTITGEYEVPVAIPMDVAQTLMRYRRLAMGGV